MATTWRQIKPQCHLLLKIAEYFNKIFCVNKFIGSLIPIYNNVRGFMEHIQINGVRPSWYGKSMCLEGHWQIVLICKEYTAIILLNQERSTVEL